MFTHKINIYYYLLISLIESVVMIIGTMLVHIAFIFVHIAYGLRINSTYYMRHIPFMLHKYNIIT